MNTHHPSDRDRGSVLPLVLVVIVVMGLVITALATYASGTLRFGQTVEASADRLAAAQGAMDNALEDIERGTSGCVTETVENGNSYSYQLATEINAIQPTVTCTVFNGDVTPIDAFAVIMTGEGRSGPLFTLTGAGGSENGKKTFTGNVYMEAVPTVGSSIELSTNLDIKEGNFKYHSDADAACTTSPNLGSHPKEIKLDPGYTTVCNDSEGWERFLDLQPIAPDVAAFPSRTDQPSQVTTSGCSVWLPGRYEVAPQLGAVNYFVSGEYYFDDIGTWNVDSAWVLAGYPGPAGPQIVTNKIKGNGEPDLSDTVAGKCQSSWDDSADDQLGAAFYMGGDSRIQIGQNASLEISGRTRDNYNLGLYALEAPGVKSILTGSDTIVQTDSGNKKQLSIHGLVWAPYTGLEFSNIANQTVAALTGGAVVSWLSAGAAAKTDNFLVTVQTQPQVLSFIVTSTAVKSGTTTVRTQILYRTTGGVHEYAVVNRRVMDLTPE